MSLSERTRNVVEIGLADRKASKELCDLVDNAADPTDAVLSSYVVASVAADIANTDTIAVAFGKIQKQMNDSDTVVAGKIGLSSVLTGYATAGTAADITAADSVLVAFGKLQKQIDDSDSVVAGKIGLSSVLTGFTVPGTASDVVAADTLLAALGKLQKQLDVGAGISWAQTATGTGGTVGQIAIPGMTATGKVIATLAEAPGAGLAFSHVVAGVDMITVYVINTGTDATAALDSKLVNYLVLSLS